LTAAQKYCPWAGASDVEKVLPLIASASYLNHIRQSWNHRNPGNKLEDQDVVVTVPASLDETAHKLTLEAAEKQLNWRVFKNLFYWKSHKLSAMTGTLVIKRQLQKNSNTSR
jgi:hypothetical protein